MQLDKTHIWSKKINKKKKVCTEVEFDVAVPLDKLVK